jgi:hypothetical protein
MRRIAHSYFLTGLLLGLVPALGQEEVRVTAPSIVENSPFLPPGFQPPGGTAGASASAPAQTGDFEFRGVYQLEGQYFFNLYNTRERKGSWVSKEASGDETPKILEFDLAKDLLVVDSSGQKVSLNLVQTSDNPLPLSVNRPPATPAQPTTLPAQPAATARQRTTPARRRVIRPTTRPSSGESATPRRVIRPTSQPSKP